MIALLGFTFDGSKDRQAGDLFGVDYCLMFPLPPPLGRDPRDIVSSLSLPAQKSLATSPLRWRYRVRAGASHRKRAVNGRADHPFIAAKSSRMVFESIQSHAVNREQLQKNVGYRVQLQPVPIRLDVLGREIGSIDGDWIIQPFTGDDIVRLLSIDTNHLAELGFDNIHHFTSNPGRSKGGLQFGFLTLTVQMYIEGPNLRFAPTLRPGERLSTVVPEIHDITVDFKFPMDSGIQRRLEGEGYTVSWCSESRLARLIEIDGCEIVIALDRKGTLCRYRLKDRRDDQVLIKKRRDPYVPSYARGNDMNGKCPVCSYDAEIGRDKDYGDKKQVDCPRCGPFQISRSAIAILNNREPDRVQRARISHGIRSRTSSADWFLLNTEHLSPMMNEPLPPIEKKLENLIGWLKLQLGDDHFGKVTLNPESLAPVVGAVDGDGVKELLGLGRDEQIIRGDGEFVGLTPKGWRLPPGEAQTSTADLMFSSNSIEWDAFICHASEDKEELVRPLAEQLTGIGLKVWYDEFALTLGDKLRRSIDRGLARSRFGIVVLSPHFFEKHWPQIELDGLAALESEDRKVILPVWHNISEHGVRQWSPTLAGRLAVSSSKGLDQVIRELLKAIRPDHPLIGTSRRDVPPTTMQSKPDPALLDFARKFHRERVEEIANGHGSVGLINHDAIIMHVVPTRAVDHGPAQAFSEIASNSERFPPVKVTPARNFKIAHDGLLIGTNVDGLDKPQRAYVHVFRKGIVESCASGIAKGRGHEFLELPYAQAILIKYLFEYAVALDSFGVKPPYVALASLIGVADVRLLQDFIPNGAIPEDIPCGIVPQRNISFGDAVISTVPRDFNDCAKILEPVLTHLANTAGLASSPYFDEDGNYMCNLK